jgi:hypothetical protein
MAGAVRDAGAAAAASPSAMFDNPAAQDPFPPPLVPCEVSLPDGVELSAECPPLRPGCAAPCSQAPNLACVYAETRRSTVVATCGEARNAGHGWRLQSASCGQPTSPIDSQFVSVDSTSCAQLAPQPCLDGMTAQEQLDLSLNELLNDINLGPAFNSVHVAFENGCATGFYEQFDRYNDAERSTLSAALASVHWACAAELSCADVYGGDKGD